MTSTRSRADGSFAPVPGGQLWVEQAGQGPAVVFAHGGTGDLRMWDEQFAALAGRYRVIRYDQRGFGRSPAAIDPFSYVADLGAVLDHVGVDTATLVGTSVGGATVIDYTLAHPDRVTALVAVAAGISGFGWQSSPEQAELESAVADGDTDRVARAALRLWAPLRTDPAVDERIRRLMVDAVPGLMMLGTMWLDHPPAYGRLGDISVPALVVVGGADQPDFRRVANLLADEIPDARQVVLPGVDHNVPVRAARELTALLADFLDQHPPTGQTSSHGRFTMTEQIDLGLDKASATVALNPDARRLHLVVLSEFAGTGHPPSRADLLRHAREHSADPQSVLAELAESDVVLFDTAGEVRAAYPFSPTPTAIRVSWDGGPTAYAMCAIDALGMSAMLDRPVVITAAEPGTGRSVTVKVDHDRARWTPATAVVYNGAIDDPCCPSADRTCGHINFFTSADAAEDWAARHPDITGTVLDQAQALDLGIAEFGALMRSKTARMTHPQPPGESA